MLSNLLMLHLKDKLFLDRCKPKSLLLASHEEALENSWERPRYQGSKIHKQRASSKMLECFA